MKAPLIRPADTVYPRAVRIFRISIVEEMIRLSEKGARFSGVRVSGMRSANQVSVRMASSIMMTNIARQVDEGTTFTITLPLGEKEH